MNIRQKYLLNYLHNINFELTGSKGRKNQNQFNFIHLLRHLNKHTVITKSNLLNQLNDLVKFGFIVSASQTNVTLKSRKDRPYRSIWYINDSLSFSEFKHSLVDQVYRSNQTGIITQEYIATILGTSQSSISRNVKKLEKIYIFEHVATEVDHKTAIMKAKYNDGYHKISNNEVYKLIGTRLKSFADNKRVNFGARICGDGFQRLSTNFKKTGFIEMKVILAKNIKKINLEERKNLRNNSIAKKFIK